MATWMSPFTLSMPATSAYVTPDATQCQALNPASTEF